MLTSLPNAKHRSESLTFWLLQHPLAQHAETLYSALDTVSKSMKSVKEVLESNSQMVIIVVAAILIFVAKKCLEKSERNKMRMKMDAAAVGGLGYGAIY